jgi:hypothetical protein
MLPNWPTNLGNGVNANGTVSQSWGSNLAAMVTRLTAMLTRGLTNKDNVFGSYVSIPLWMQDTKLVISNPLPGNPAPFPIGARVCQCWTATGGPATEPLLQLTREPPLQSGGPAMVGLQPHFVTGSGSGGTALVWLEGG